MSGAVDPLDGEIAKVNQLTRDLIEEYLAWGSKIVHGDTWYLMYDDVLDYVNFRIETAYSCLSLIEQRKIADSLGLSRSLLEHYLLLMRICRGRKFFRLQDLSTLTEAEFKARLVKQEAELAEQQVEGETQCLYVKKYPRAKRHLMYVFEGLKDRDEPELITPIHFFHFQEFHPETMRLKDEDYFEYYELEPEAAKIMRGHQEEAVIRYRHYLSYDALLYCLELNDLTDASVTARIEAHYTFLGKFLHPTHQSARDLHDDSNIHSGGTAIGMGQRYAKLAVLLASLYVCYLVAGLMDEAAGLIENAPPNYVREAGTGELRALIARATEEFPYFWFLFNDPPLWDRYNYCIHHATDNELAEWGHYGNVPKERVTFDQHIYGHLQDALMSYRNTRLGSYSSPLA